MYIERYVEINPKLSHSLINNESIEEFYSMIDSIQIMIDNYNNNCTLLESSGLLLEDSNKAINILTEGFLGKIWETLKRLIKKLRDYILRIFKIGDRGKWLARQKSAIKKYKTMGNVPFDELDSEECKEALDKFINTDSLSCIGAYVDSRKTNNLKKNI